MTHIATTLSTVRLNSQEIADGDVPWTIFVETPSTPPRSNIADPTDQAVSLLYDALDAAPSSNPISALATPLPAFDQDKDVLLFFKFFDPFSRSLRYVGYQYLSINLGLRQLFPRLWRLAGLTSQTPISLYEEVKPTMIEAIEDCDSPLEKV